jgi:hypothetical protein
MDYTPSPRLIRCNLRAPFLYQWSPPFYNPGLLPNAVWLILIIEFERRNDWLKEVGQTVAIALRPTYSSCITSLSAFEMSSFLDVGNAMLMLHFGLTGKVSSIGGRRWLWDRPTYERSCFGRFA